MSQTDEPKFPPGQIFATHSVLERFLPDQITNSLKRHSRGDWGDVCAEDWQANEVALAKGRRILSAYQFEGVGRIWIITEADRSVTTLLLPEEY